MATESSRVVMGGQEELPASGAVAHTPGGTHTRSLSHIQFQPPPPRTSQWQATLSHSRSHSHTHFITPSHMQSQKYGCRLTHSLSAMTKGDRGVQGSGGKLIKPSEPLFHKTPQQTNLSQKLSVCSKLCFAIGGAPKEVAGSATAFFLQIYLLDVAQINAFQASMVLFLGKVWGAVTDPIVGFFMTKSRWTKIGRLMPCLMLVFVQNSNKNRQRVPLSEEDFEASLRLCRLT